MHPRLIFLAVAACALELSGVAAAAPASPATPGKAYMQYYVALRGAFQLEEVLPHLSRQARTELERALREAKFRALAPHERAAAKRALLEQRRLMGFDPAEPIEVLHESVRGARATLLAEGLLREPTETLREALLSGGALPPRRLGQATVVLVRERGAWRVDREAIDAVAPPPLPMPGPGGRATMPATPAPTPTPAATPSVSPSATGAPVLPAPQLPTGGARPSPTP